VIRPILADSARHALARAFANQLADHFQEQGVNADRRGADHLYSPGITDLAGFRIEIVEHFHVIGDETDRYDHDIGAGIHFAQHISDVGLQPRLAGGAAAALIH
jgi:hypothetical protein